MVQRWSADMSIVDLCSQLRRKAARRDSSCACSLNSSKSSNSNKRKYDVSHCSTLERCSYPQWITDELSDRGEDISLKSYHWSFVVRSTVEDWTDRVWSSVSMKNRHLNKQGAFIRSLDVCDVCPLASGSFNHGRQQRRTERSLQR